jgi:hypothetical protein
MCVSVCVHAQLRVHHCYLWESQIAVHLDIPEVEAYLFFILLTTYFNFNS